MNEIFHLALYKYSNEMKKKKHENKTIFKDNFFQLDNEYNHRKNGFIGLKTEGDLRTLCLGFFSASNGTLGLFFNDILYSFSYF